MTSEWKKQGFWVCLGQGTICMFYVGTGLGIVAWVAHLFHLSMVLKDSQSASIGISIVAIPVFFSLMSVFIYMFYGIALTGQKEENPNGESQPQPGQEL